MVFMFLYISFFLVSCIFANTVCPEDSGRHYKAIFPARAPGP